MVRLTLLIKYLLTDIPIGAVFSIHEYPAREIEPVASALATELTYYNWWGRTRLHIREGKERVQRLEGLILACRFEIDEMKRHEAELEVEKKKLDVATKMYAEIQEELRNRQANEEILRCNIHTLKKYPVIDAGIRTFVPVKRSHTRTMSNPESPTKSSSITSFLLATDEKPKPSRRPAIYHMACHTGVFASDVHGTCVE